jgi:glyoxylase-like metal-dependent hydrolase (beta-lactamase superfamily II)
MKTGKYKEACLLLTIAILLGGCAGPVTRMSPNLSLIRGDINGAVIESGKDRLVIYGDPAGVLSGADLVLFTHARRDVVWAGSHLVEKGAGTIVPAAESDLFTSVDSFWNDLCRSRYHDYRQQSTKWPTEPMRVSRSVRHGDTIQWKGIPIQVIGSKGYTRGAVTYLARIDGMDVAFTGDLIYGNGQILDLYSLQDQIEEAQVRGYHGYASRMAELIGSLENIAALEPDLLVPVRGPVIREPEEAIGKLISRLRQHYRNYLSVNAYRWYTGQERQDIMARRVLAPDMEVDWMELAETGKNPPWLIHHHNSKLILSEDGGGFLIDCGVPAVFKDVIEIGENFPCSGIEGIFITHYHDDHTDFVNGIQEKYGCPVYVTALLEDILRHPGAYRMPAMTSVPLKGIVTVPDASTMRWKEFTFTFYDLPGQTLYHDALLVERDGGEKIFFAGDSFSPSGLDDYCLLNRNFIQPGTGYLYCLDLLRQLPEESWIVNQHIEPPFRFNGQQLDLMTARLLERKALLRELFPWDEPNYGIDERWARMYPYGQAVRPGQTVSFSVMIQNHSDRPQTYTIRPVPGEDGLRVSPGELVISVSPKEEGRAEFTLEASGDARPGIRVQKADIGFGGWHLREWCESIIEVRAPA